MLRNSVKKLSLFLIPKSIVKPHPKYISYIGWSFLSNITVSIENVISTHSILASIGTCDIESNITAHYITKNIIGQLGSLPFINIYSKLADKNPKKFGNISMFFQQISPYLECATPFISLNGFIYIAGSANMFRNISFTGFAAINTKVIEKLNTGDNIAEIYSKFCIINSIGSTIGMIIGILITKWIPDHYTRYCLIPFLTMIRMYTFKKSIEGILD